MLCRKLRHIKHATADAAPPCYVVRCSSAAQPYQCGARAAGWRLRCAISSNSRAVSPARGKDLHNMLAHLQWALMVCVSTIEDLDVPLVVLRLSFPVELPVAYFEVVMLQAASCKAVRDALEEGPYCVVCAAGQPVLEELGVAASYPNLILLLAVKRFAGFRLGKDGRHA